MPLRFDWADMVPPASLNRARPTRQRKRLLSRLLHWSPWILAVAAVASGLAGMAVQQSASAPAPIVRTVAPPTTDRPTPLIDLNTATIAELSTLPGVGAARAEAIVALRARQPFAALIDLVDRGVLRPSELLRIADLAAVYAPDQR